MSRAAVDRSTRTAGYRGVAAAVILCASGMASCSLLLDWSGYSGGERPEAGHGDEKADDDASGDGAFIDAPPPVPCGAGMACAPAVPAGWGGPYGVLTGAPGTLPDCDPTSYASTPAFDGKRGLDAGPAVCTCGCTLPGCDPPAITFYSDSVCSVPCGPAAPLNRCVQIPMSSCNGANLTISAPAPSGGGACIPDGSASVPTAAWSDEIRACVPRDAAPASCSTGQTCLPNGTPFCIGLAGDVACPNGDYPIRRVYYEGLDDERGCLACTCSTIKPPSCFFPPPSLGVGSFDQTCTIPTGQPFIVPVGCTGRVPSALALAQLFDASIEGGACAPGGGSQDGGATPTMPMTFCCTR
jgi:hypothetical protein